MTTPLDRLAEALKDRYTLERELGAGGMATVYLAHDVKHDRKVAIKVLKPELAAVLGAERFIQEIRTTAHLQHPNILPLFDSGSVDGFLYYVMPFVEGETLRARLNRETQLGVEESVKLVSEVADALQYAHDHGVVHRDIKPENILLHAGRPMVADFGIALAVSAAAGGRMTETGLSLGTPHYMSPEQATADKHITSRSDIYSLAAVLYEMLAGEPPHMGNSAQAIIMKIVTDDARPVTELRRSVPPNVGAAIALALQRVAADRFESAKAFGEALANPGFTVAGHAAQPVERAGARSRRFLTHLRDPLVALPPLLVAAVAIAIWFACGRPTVGPTLPPIRYVLTTTDSVVPVDGRPWPAAISPDGGTIVYSGSAAGREPMLYALRTDRLQALAIPGTNNATQPYFSPDGDWLAFEQDGKERKVRLDGSQPITIGEGGGNNGATWTQGGMIVIGAGPFRGLSRVSAAGGETVALTGVDTAGREANHLWPVAVPGTRLVAFAIWYGSLNASRLALASVDDGTITRLGLPGIRPLAVLDGMLVYVQADGAVMAVTLDAARGRIRGNPIPVHDPVRVLLANNGNSSIYVSQGGAVVTSGGQGGATRLAWMDLAGQTRLLVPDPYTLAGPRFSPDGRRVAVVAGTGSAADVWIYDLGLNTFSRLTTLGTVTSVDWATEGASVVFTATTDAALGGIWIQDARGGSPPRMLHDQAERTLAATMSPDGRSLLATVLHDNNWVFLRIPLDSASNPQVYVFATATRQPQFAPNGSWVAMVATETGRPEIYVQSFPDPGVKVQVSAGGGSWPRWARDGSRLYYSSGTALLAARVTFSPTFAVLGRDTVVANTPLANATASGFSVDYDVGQDGRGFVGVVREGGAIQLIVSPNWITEFRRRVAEGLAMR